jgi:hypothetical protein
LAVYSGATLRGNGAFGGTVGINGGTLAPGDGIGTLRTGNLLLGASSKLDLQIGSVSAFDRVEVTGAVTLDGPVQLTLSTTFDPQDGADSFVIISNDGIDPILGNGRFTSGGVTLQEGMRFVASGQEWLISYRGGSESNDVVLYAVPEPGTTAMLVLGAGAFAGLRRRRRG